MFTSADCTKNSESVQEHTCIAGFRQSQGFLLPTVQKYLSSFIYPTRVSLRDTGVSVFLMFSLDKMFCVFSVCAIYPVDGRVLLPYFDVTIGSLGALVSL